MLGLALKSGYYYYVEAYKTKIEIKICHKVH